MKGYMKDYLSKIYKQMSGIQKDDNDIEEDFLRHLSFFQHERLIHLIVTALFAILTLLSAGFSAVTSDILFPVLSIIFLIMTGAYIFHYYFLENTVQEMYKIYDKIEKNKQISKNLKNIETKEKNSN